MLIPADVKLFLYTPPTDMRKSIDTLCMLVANVLKMTPTDGHLFLFRNRGNKKARGQVKFKVIQVDQHTFFYLKR